jgi:phage shock protein A
MSTMIAEVYDALKDAGASEEKAKAAATALANYDSRFDGVDRQLASLVADVTILKSDVAALKSDVAALKSDVAALKMELTSIKVDFATLKAELGMLKWMIGGVGFGTLLLILRSFWPA